MIVKQIKNADKELLESIVNIHLVAFEKFFLTFMGKDFLKLMYLSYTEYDNSGILVAIQEDKPIGFLAYSGDMSGLYKYMIRKRLFLFGIYSFVALVKKPKIFMRLLRSFLKPSETKRREKYVELASIGVNPKFKSSGVGSTLIDNLKNNIAFSQYSYIALETDAVNNALANDFYKKNGFILVRSYSTNEGRLMNEYRFYMESENT
ncbi:GNAT family N-acetyltransferase [Enterococcus mundtii]|uniref:GNAT family N-acetyltransferase n=1 Tax=Enterococcus mundtii TaxID=53346 RepID=A0A2S7RP63_ENTMU|nr:GNAT family N-acetyltransferase [Enterococcus mundtii]PQF21034.1 GNAT family N-acetyltransferase [Enterococcus mundtii]